MAVTIGHFGERGENVMRKLRIATVLVGAVLLTTLCGCGKDEMEREKLEYVWSVDETDIGAYLSVKSPVAVGSGIHMLAERSGEAGRSGYILVFDAETRSVDEYSLDSLSPTISPVDIAALDDESLLILTRDYDETVSRAVYSLYTLRGGEFSLYYADLDLAQGMDGDTEPSGVCVMGDGSICLSCDVMTVVYDSDMNMLYSVDHADGFVESDAASDGTVYITYISHGDNGGIATAPIDTSSRSLGEKLNLSGIGANDFADPCFGQGSLLYALSDDGLYSCDGTNGSEKLCDWLNSNIVKNDIRELLMLDINRMFAVMSDFTVVDGQYVYSLALLDRVPEDELKEYIILDFAVANPQEWVLDSIVEFNRTNDDCRVVVVDWSEYETDELSSTEVLSREMLKGNVPDIVMTSNFSGSDSWISQGIFRDLYEFIDGDDSFSRDDYNWEVVSGYEADEKLPIFVLTYKLSTLVAKKSVIAENLTTGEFIDLAENLPDDKFLVSRSYDMLKYFVSASLDSYVDFDAGECHFDGEEFRRVMEYTKEMYSAPDYASTLSGEDRWMADGMMPLRLDKVLIGEVSRASDYKELLSILYLAAESPEELAIIGYPSNDGRGTVVSIDTSVAVANDTPAGESAWEFVKLLSKNAGSDEFMSGFATHNDVLHKNFSKLVGTKCVFGPDSTATYTGDVSEEEIERMIESSHGVYHEVTEADFELISRFFVNVKPKHGDAVSRNIVNIIYEEMLPYIDGVKSLDETQELIQSRVSLLVSERS